jgi:DNA repair exonuclease SbcCD ATPase subunit
MIKLTLNNFRRWSNISLNFRLGEATLIKGVIGSGKSTIFEAIYWCLYGNLRSVTPHFKKKVRTSVTLSLPRDNQELIIIRKNYPQELFVTWFNKTYDQDVAQSLINEWFGSEDLWLMSSYLVQKERNKFFNCTQQSKWNLLQEIAYQSENPENYFKIINDKYREKEVSYQNTLTTYDYNYDQYQVNFKDKKVNSKDLLDLDLVNNYRKEIKEKQDLLKQLQASEYQRKTTLILREQLISKLQKLLNDNDVKDILKPKLNHNLTNIFNDNVDNNWQAYLEFLQELRHKIINYNKLCNEYQKYNNVTMPQIIYDQKDYEKALQQELQYEQQEKIAAKYQLTYDKVIIEKQISLCHEQINGQDYLQLQKEKETFENNILQWAKEQDQLKFLPIPDKKEYVVNFDKQKLENIQIKIREVESELQQLNLELKDISHTYQCPQCQTYVFLVDDKLQTTEISPDILDNKHNLQQLKEKELQKLKYDQLQLDKQHKLEIQKVQKAEKEYENLVLQAKLSNERMQMKKLEYDNKISLAHKEVENINVKLQSCIVYNGTLLNKQQIIKLQQKCYELEKINFLSLPVVKSSEIHNLLQEQQKFLRKQEYESQLLKLKVFENICLSDIDLELSSIKRFINDKQEYERNKQRKECEKKMYEDQLQSLILPKDASNKIQEIIEYVDLLQDKLAKNDVMTEKKKLYNKLTQDREQVMDIHNNLYLLSELQSYGKKAECYMLQSVVDNVNETLEEILMSLFQEPFEMNLELYKQPKSTKIEKPQVNFNITYRGAPYDGLRGLSGGEGDCASLALTLALHRLTGNSFIIIDESSSSMDEKMRETTLNYLKSKKITALITLHQAVEGFFDNIIDVSEYH